MRQQARELFARLDPTQRQRLLFPLEHPERGNWNYMPAPRSGVALRELSADQREAAHALLRAALSDRGYAKAAGIMELEAILGELEGRPPGDRLRDPGGYFLTLFGRLDGGGPWGWRLDGHHLSLNFTLVTRELAAVTPAFFGANPAVVPGGPRRGWRLLSDEELLARQLVRRFTGERLERVLLAAVAPRDIVSGRDRLIAPGMPAGLPAGEMEEPERELFRRLVGVYLGNLRPELAEAVLERLRRAGLERLHFAWAGGLEPGEGHYYRIQGPTLLIEYDNTQNQANHIHTVLRDPERDFGRDLLAAHYRESAHHD